MSRPPPIRDTSAQDAPRDEARRLPAVRRWLWPTVAGVAVLAVAGWVVASWGDGARSYDASRLRIAEVTRGDLVRDLSAEGRVIAANSPTLYAIAGGTVILKVVAGDRVEVRGTLGNPDWPHPSAGDVRQAARLVTAVTAAATALAATTAALVTRRTR